MGEAGRKQWRAGLIEWRKEQTDSQWAEAAGQGFGRVELRD